MANRPRVNGWENIDQKKPAEYSSEFTIDGNRYANVTNVTTGQRQLYLVSGLGGTPLTQRTLLTSTNADGTVTKGEGYDDFIRAYDRERLRTADRENKKQSLFIIEKASTEEEKEDLGNTKEYKSLKNKSKKDEDNNPVLDVIELATDLLSRFSPLKGKGPQYYPNNIANTKQDRIKFVAAQQAKRNLKEPLSFKAADAAAVYIAIQGPISDQNAVSWGEKDLPLAELAMGEIAKNEIGNGTGASTAGQLISEALEGISDEQNKKTILAAAAANNMSLFTRATQQVLNPNIELLFDKPQLRSFTFNFKMSARDRDEAETIKNIIKFFKYHSAIKASEGILFLGAPDVFWIEYQKGNGELHPSLNLIAPQAAKTKACALQQMSVNYTPLGSYMTYDDREATMVQYDLSLTFQELTPVYQVDYTGEYYDSETVKTEGVVKHPIGY